jgi:hypothetical protein
MRTLYICDLSITFEPLTNCLCSNIYFLLWPLFMQYFNNVDGDLKIEEMIFFINARCDI